MPVEPYTSVMKSHFKKLESAGGEVKNILIHGRKAKESQDAADIQLFLSMYAALDRYYVKYETSWEKLVDEFEDQDRANEFPNDAYVERQALKGSAATVISHLKVDHNNYELAYRALVETYDNQRLLANAYLHQVLSFKPPNAPATVLMKSLIQMLWKAKVGWDDPIPSDIQKLWQTILDELPTLSNIRIPRLSGVVPISGPQELQFERSWSKNLLENDEDCKNAYCACAKRRRSPFLPS
ncbi:unnamed protein product, partial [Nesidiocoris tenuis]